MAIRLFTQGIRRALIARSAPLHRTDVDPLHSDLFGAGRIVLFPKTIPDLMIPASDIQDGGLTYIIRSPLEIRLAYQDGRGFKHEGRETLAYPVAPADRSPLAAPAELFVRSHEMSATIRRHRGTP